MNQLRFRDFGKLSITRWRSGVWEITGRGLGGLGSGWVWEMIGRGTRGEGKHASRKRYSWRTPRIDEEKRKDRNMQARLDLDALGFGPNGMYYDTFDVCPQWWHHTTHAHPNERINQPRPSPLFWDTTPGGPKREASSRTRGRCLDLGYLLWIRRRRRSG